MPQTALCDAFISYKSQNVDVARRITDRLIASGLRVWFAEYEVLLVGRERFQEAIDEGIRACQWGIVLTNDAYANSEYCGREIHQLLAYCGPDRIIEIRIPAEPAVRRKYPALERSKCIDYQDNLEEVFSFIAGVTQWRLQPALKGLEGQAGLLHHGTCTGLPFSIEVTGWTLIDESFKGGGPRYDFRLGKYRIAMNLQYGVELSQRVYEARRRDNNNDERVLFDLMCEYANKYFKAKRPARIEGVHLFLLDGVSHFGLTYQDRHWWNSMIWKRRASIMLLDSASYRAAEFVFTFECAGRLSDYCLLANIMDEVVTSLRWGSAPTNESSDPVLPATASPDLQSSVRELLPAHKLMDERLASLEREQGKKAVEQLQLQVADLAPVNRIFNEGIVFLRRGDFAEGIARLQQALTYSMVAQLRGQVLFNLGLAFEKSGDRERAIENYEASISAHPLQFNALCNLGSLHYNAGDLEAALAHYLSAAEINPSDRITIDNLVMIFRKLGDVENFEKWNKVRIGLTSR